MPFDVRETAACWPFCFIAAMALAAGPARADGAVAGDVAASWTRTVNKDGSATVVLANQVSAWDGAVFGVDAALASRSAAATAAGIAQTDNGTAYAKVALPTAAVGLPWEATVQVRANPVEDDGKVSTTFARSYSLADGMKATWSESYALVRSSGAETWEAGRSVSVKMVETGTTVSLGTKVSSDALGLLQPSISAEQTLFSGLNVTTSLAEGTDGLSRSISAGFKHRW